MIGACDGMPSVYACHGVMIGQLRTEGVNLECDWCIGASIVWVLGLCMCKQYVL